jgi:Co/Zn/Cd efflux system component
VLADALTSLLAIAALLAAKYSGAVWMDPVMGIVGSLLIARWSVGLLRSTSRILLDREVASDMHERVRTSLDDDDTRVTDLHIWCIGPGVFALIAVLVSRDPQSPEHYKAKLPGDIGLRHTSIEIHSEAPAAA